MGLGLPRQRADLRRSPSSLGRFFVPTTTRPATTPSTRSARCFSIIGLMGLLFAIIEVPDRGLVATPSCSSPFAVGVVFLAAFAWWETHYEHPMLDLHFFQNPRFSAASATITLTFFALYGSTFLLTQYFQFVLRLLAAQGRACSTAPVAIGIMVTAPQAPKLVERIGTKLRRRRSGCSIVAAGLLLVLGRAGDVLVRSVAALVRLLFGVGMGLVIAPATESIMGSLPKAKAGVGSAVNDTTRQAGGALGVAVIGSVFAATYHRVIEVPAGLPAGAAPDGARLHRQGPRGDHHASTSRPPGRQRCTTPPSDAFFRGMQVAAWVGTRRRPVRRRRRLSLPAGSRRPGRARGR